MIKLQVYSEIFSGYSFRKSLEISGKNGVGVIQLKDVNASSGEIDYLTLANASDFTGSDKYFLRDRDILLISKGNNNKAVLFEKNKYPHPLLPSGAFIVIRPMQDYLDSLYIWWYLNLPESQEQFKMLQAKTTVHNLAIDSLRNFGIRMPNLSTQRVIGETYLLRQEEIQTAKLRDEKWTILINEKLKRLLQ